MAKIAILGSGFIARFYADSLQGQRSRDKIVSVYSRREESAKKFATDYQVAHHTTEMEAAVADILYLSCAAFAPAMGAVAAQVPRERAEDVP